MSTSPSPYSANPYPNPIGVEDLSIAVISPSEGRRHEAVHAMNGCAGTYVSEFSSYTPGLGDLPQTLDEDYDVIVIDLDGDAEIALDLVENIGANSAATVMVYSESSDPELLVRCMRAGAREFLTLPFSRGRGGGGAGAGGGAAAGSAAEQENQREALCVHGIEGRGRHNHAGHQFCRSAGQGIGREDSADRSRSSAGRCRAESGNYRGVLDNRCAAAGGSAGREVS